jgi:hypothetical protein
MKKSQILELALEKVISQEADFTCHAITYIVDEDFGNPETEKNGSELKDWVLDLLEGYGTLGFWLAHKGFRIGNKSIGIGNRPPDNYTMAFWAKVRETRIEWIKWMIQYWKEKE